MIRPESECCKSTNTMKWVHCRKGSGMLKMQRSFSPTWTLVLLIHLVWMSSTMVFSPVEAARSKVLESEYSSGTHLASRFVFCSPVQCAWVIAFLFKRYDCRSCSVFRVFSVHAEGRTSLCTALTPRYEKSPRSEVATQIDESSVFSNVASRVSIPTTVKYRPGF